MNAHSRTIKSECHRSGLQRGIVLEIVLIALLALMMVSVSLFRSVDTSTTVVRNVSFKSDATNRAQVAFDHVIAWAGNAANYMQYIDQGVDLANRNYSARMLATDPQGIPTIIKDPAAFDAAYAFNPPNTAIVNDAGMKFRFLIERMCTDTGVLVREKCTYISEHDLGGSGHELKKPAKPALRVTVRVDGPQSTVSYVQATVSP